MEVSGSSLWKKVLNWNVYNYLILFLVLLAILYINDLGLSVLQQVIVIPLVAALVDLAIALLKKKKLFVPKTAIISGLIITLLLPADLMLQILIPIIAIISKHIIQIKGRNIFNPAVFALFVASLFSFGISWAGVGTPLVILGLFISYRIHRLRMSIMFLVTYFIINALIGGFFFDPLVIFFATIMLLEPKTSPSRRRGMLLFGIITAVLVFLFPYAAIPLDPFITSLLIMNLFTRRLNKI